MENEKKIAVLCVATASYQYALYAHARAIKQNATAAGVTSGHFILVTCQKPVEGILAHYRAILGESWEIHHIPLNVQDGHKNYKEDAQLVIAQLFTAGFDQARALGVDYVWTVESDVIPEANNLRCLLDMLAFDGGYYGVAFVPYVSQGGGGFMGGRATDGNWILPNAYEEERELPPELAAQVEEYRTRLAGTNNPPKELLEEGQRLNTLVMEQPPKGNVFKLNSERWRKRGWLEWAYPEVGKGAALESDWMPMGNNLFSKKALNLVDFLGYQGKATQDLYCYFRRLKPHGIRLCVVPHCVSHHVVRRKDEGGNTVYKLLFMYHEPSGEYEGHLRHREEPFYTHEAGEAFQSPTPALEYEI